MDVRLGIVTGRETGNNRGNAVQSRMLQVMLTTDDDVQTVQLVGQNGEECNPPDGSLVVVVGAGTAYKLAVGTDDAVVPDMEIGGKRVYSTDATGATVMAQMRIDPDGKVTVSNGVASFTMNVDGSFSFHGTRSDFDHPVYAPDLYFDGRSAVGHTHSDPQGGDTGVPV